MTDDDAFEDGTVLLRYLMEDLTPTQALYTYLVDDCGYPLHLVANAPSNSKTTRTVVQGVEKGREALADDDPQLPVVADQETDE